MTDDREEKLHLLDHGGGSVQYGSDTRKVSPANTKSNNKGDNGAHSGDSTFFVSFNRPGDEATGEMVSHHQLR